ncbi:MAG: hypothetical protein N3A69_17715, partial [Leptospiraceae bacterium]|nr:hypothetical protein [Leptospiraceae bacterium]
PATSFAGTNGLLYTALLDLPSVSTGNWSIPQGNGWLTVSVRPNGLIRIGGQLADSTALIGTTSLGPDGEVLINLPIYGNKGLISGISKIIPHANSPVQNSLTGSLVWIKQNISSGSGLVQGFSTSLLVSGGPYIPPPVGQRILDFGSSPGNVPVDLEVTFVLPEPSSSFVTKFGISTKNTLELLSPIPDPYSTKLILFPNTGAFSGTFLDRRFTPPRSTNFQGILCLNPNATESAVRGGGYFLYPASTSNSTLLSGQIILLKP